MSSTDKKQKTVIGTAALEYNEEGKLEAAVFYPKIKVKFDDIKEQLGNCCSRSIDDIKNSAQLLLATFFSKMNEIELRDMEKTTLSADIVRSQNHDNGTIKEVEIEFVYGR